MSRVRTALLAIAFALGTVLATPVFAGEPDWKAINAMDQHAFVQKFGGIFEKSPWVAEKAWEARPFSSIDDLHAKMVAVAKYANIDQELWLCCALTPILPARRRRRAR